MTTKTSTVAPRHCLRDAAKYYCRNTKTSYPYRYDSSTCSVVQYSTHAHTQHPLYHASIATDYYGTRLFLPVLITHLNNGSDQLFKLQFQSLQRRHLQPACLAHVS